MTHASLAREAGCNPVIAGFDPRVRLHGPWSRGQGGSLLRSKRAFESRRADVVLTFMAQLNVRTLPVRIWLVLRSARISLRN